jgi:hypothetical protein
VSHDIDGAMNGWKFKGETIQARRVTARDGRDVLQMRIELGVLQLEIDGRPDGERPGGFPTYYDFLKSKSLAAKLAGKGFQLAPNHCEHADREFLQFYHRRVCWLALGEFEFAVRDADHTLAFMDFVRDHSPDEHFTRAHEQYRGFVLFHRAQAQAAARAEAGDAEGAVDALRAGSAAVRKQLREFANIDPDEDEEGDDDDSDNPMLQQLLKMEEEFRSRHGVGSTLQEQLDEAIAAEQYERAAALRDVIRGKRTAEGGGA